MALYKIYHGLGGGFGGAQYDRTEEFDSLDDAETAAYNDAIADYESYEGLYGLYSYDDVVEEFCFNANYESRDEITGDDIDYINEEYGEARDSWLDYFAIEVKDGENPNGD